VAFPERLYNDEANVFGLSPLPKQKILHRPTSRWVFKMILSGRFPGCIRPKPNFVIERPKIVAGRTRAVRAFVACFRRLTPEQITASQHCQYSPRTGDQTIPLMKVRTASRRTSAAGVEPACINRRASLMAPNHRRRRLVMAELHVNLPISTIVSVRFIPAFLYSSVGRLHCAYRRLVKPPSSATVFRIWSVNKGKLPPAALSFVCQLGVM